MYLSADLEENVKRESLNKVKFLLVELEQRDFEIEFEPLENIKDHLLLLH